MDLVLYIIFLAFVSNTGALCSVKIIMHREDEETQKDKCDTQDEEI